MGEMGGGVGGRMHCTLQACEISIAESNWKCGLTEWLRLTVVDFRIRLDDDCAIGIEW